MKDLEDRFEVAARRHRHIKIAGQLDEQIKKSIALDPAKPTFTGWVIDAIQRKLREEAK